jgi:hypothetical protein
VVDTAIGRLRYGLYGFGAAACQTNSYMTCHGGPSAVDWRRMSDRGEGAPESARFANQSTACS